MTKWLERTKPVVPACLIFGAVMTERRFWPGSWLLIAGLAWLWLAIEDDRRTIAAMTAQLTARQTEPASAKTARTTDATGGRNAFAWGLYAVGALALFALNWLGGDVTIRSVVAQAAIIGLMTLAIVLQHRAEHRSA